MSRAKTIYTCQNCGAQAPKWLGKCPDCNQWNTYAEEIVSQAAGKQSGLIDFASLPPKPITEIDAKEGLHIPVGMGELDRVLGGGYVPGSTVLIGGEPGIGKSTLLLQTLSRLAQSGKKVLYVSGEESAAQIKMRGERLGAASANLWVVTENSLERILEILKKDSPQILAIDSIQTLYTGQLSSAPGTVSQVRESTGHLITWAKRQGTTCFFVGHVTKEGSLAGPKVLEHMVDCVLYFESDPGQTLRILRACKNRYGATHELGIFEMTGQGLKEIENPSNIFLGERNQKNPGSVVTASLEGTRPLLLEIQTLVTHSGLANPRRTCIGADNSRVALLVAVLEKIVGLQLYDQDIFVNIAGGIKTEEPALDLGMAVGIFSSFRNLAVDPKTVLIGEVGLTGEVRPVQRIDMRLQEAAKLGMARALIPSRNTPGTKELKNFQITPVKNIEECLHQLF
ncbi:MAG: DNA repair protein RadA [Deltaproteobacteria bacterium]|nr:DNA repair protein RadA [Deltaproteobacteria bacterium]